MKFLNCNAANHKAQNQKTLNRENRATHLNSYSYKKTPITAQHLLVIPIIIYWVVHTHDLYLSSVLTAYTYCRVQKYFIFIFA